MAPPQPPVVTGSAACMRSCGHGWDLHVCFMAQAIHRHTLFCCSGHGCGIKFWCMLLSSCRQLLDHWRDPQHAAQHAQPDAHQLVQQVRFAPSRETRHKCIDGANLSLSRAAACRSRSSDTGTPAELHRTIASCTCFWLLSLLPLFRFVLTAVRAVMCVVVVVVAVG